MEEEGPDAGDAVRGGRQRPPSIESGTTLSAECFEPNKETFTKLTLYGRTAACRWEEGAGMERNMMRREDLQKSTWDWRNNPEVAPWAHWKDIYLYLVGWCVCVCVLWDTHEDQVSSLLPSCGFSGWKGHQAWQQEPFEQTFFFFLIPKGIYTNINHFLTSVCVPFLDCHKELSKHWLVAYFGITVISSLSSLSRS